MPQAIIFDLWETLGSKPFSVSQHLREALRIPDSPGYLQRYEAAVQLHEWQTIEEMAAGFLNAFSVEISKPSLSLVEGAFMAGMSSCTVNPGIPALLKRLAARYRLGLLSNTTVFESSVVKTWGIDELFHSRVYSWQTGYLKPAEQAFRHILTALAAQPEECVFIDDGKQNVLAGAELGMRSYLYSDVESLSRRLVVDGIL
jgi:HAD superfamily hydrolase (TIGR01509 family)